jgi:tetratricopeptide (TPR) repeat protein
MKLSHIKPTDEELRVMLEVGYLLREAARFDESKAIFYGVSELIPNSEVPKVALGTVELQSGKFELAQIACEEALQLNPESLYARVHRAEALLFQHKREEAEQELLAVIEKNENSPHSRTAKALLDVADLISPP